MLHMLQEPVSQMLCRGTMQTTLKTWFHEKVVVCYGFGCAKYNYLPKSWPVYGQYLQVYSDGLMTV
jgi:hypothetical protein